MKIKSFTTIHGRINCSDAEDFLSQMPDNCANVVFLDPPFNLGKRYGARKTAADKLDDSDYMDFMSSIVNEAVRILKPGGALFLYHLPYWAMRIGAYAQTQLSFRHWIAIAMKNGFVRGKRLYPAHYSLLYFTKGNPRSFMRPRIPLQTCRHCGKLVKDYGGYKHYVRNGVNLSDFWEDLSPVRHAKFKTRVANELPMELLRRIMKISGRPGYVLVDPFMGSGTSLIAAVDAKMQYLAADREASYCRLANRRVSSHITESDKIMRGSKRETQRAFGAKERSRGKRD